MKMRRVLALVMAVLMVIGLMPAISADGGTTEPVTSVSIDNGFVHVNKSVNPEGTELTLEAYLTNEVTQTVSAKPLDIVLVLDQSGSMADSFGNDTRQAAMKNAVNAFIEEVAAKNGDHRMAIVTFGSDAQRLVEEWTTVDGSGKTQLTAAINGLPKNPSGATNVGAGMEVAKLLMDSATDTETDTDRQKVVIVFTDGVPTTTNTFSTAVANTAITAAKSMKDSGVTIYAVGIFNGANPDEMYGASGFDTNSDGTVGSEWGEDNWGFFPDTDFPKTDRPAGNRFLNLVSSNYLSADSLGLKRNEDGLGILHSAISYKITKNFDRVEDVNYYLTAINDTSLTNMFQQIVQEISTLDIVADENTILSDTLSEYFTLNVPEGNTEAGAITVEQWNCTGMDNNGDYTWEKAATQPAIQVNVNGKKIEVTDFNYSENAVTKLTIDNDTYYSGSKLVVKIPIMKDDTCTSWITGKHPYPTNSVAEGSKAGLSNYKEKDGEEHLSTLLNESPEVEVEVAEQTYTVTYEFVSDDPNAALPYNVYEVLPSDNGKYKKDDEVEIAQEPADVTFYGYTWTFLRWEINDEKVDAGSTRKMPEGDLKIVGIWTRGVPEYRVTYSYAESTPAEITNIPSDDGQYTTAEFVTALRPEVDTVDVNGVTWKFKYWTLEIDNEEKIIPANTSVQMVKGGLHFVGIWEAEEIEQKPAFKVEFNANGGYWTDGSDATVPKSEYIYEGTERITAPDVKKDAAKFIGWYIKANDGSVHPIEFDLKDFGYDQAVLFEEDYVTYTDDDGVTTFAVFAQYEENAEQTYTVTYEFVSDDPNAALPYNVYEVLPSDNGKYKKDDEVEIAQEPADVTFYGYTWTFLRWEINDEKVDAGSTRKMPEGGLKIVGIWTRGVPEYGVTYEYKESANEPLPDEVKDTLPHDEYTYSANQEVSIKRPTPDSVTTSDGTVWTFEGWTLNGVSVSGSVQMDKELLSDDGVLAFVGTWKSEKVDPTPAAPVVDVKVIVSCVNDPDGKDDKLYYVNPGNPGLYTVERNGVFEKNGTYKYVINLINAYFVKQYSEALNIDHTLAENVEAKVTYTYDKESELWTPDKETVTINVVCRQDPDPEEYTVVINFDKTSGTWADNSNDGTKTIAFNENDTTTRNVPKVKESTFKGWYSGNTRIAIGDTLNFATAMQIVRDLGITPTDVNGVKHYEVTLYADYSTTTPDYPPFIVLFPTLEISNKVIAPKNFEKTSFEYDIINVKTGDVEKSVTLKADSSVRVMVTGGTEYMVVPKNLEVPGYIVTTTSTPDSATVTSDKVGNVSVDFTHIYVVGLNTEDHYAYIRGYEDGTIRPEGNITRAEVATIFYRLLSSEALAAFKTTENTFTDVDSDAWYNLSVSTLAKAGVISGYPDGSFNPNGKITRAELVSIATRFFTTIEVGDSKFSDIAGHWAAKAIDEAYIKGIIKGYSDGTFRPDQAVTRAEAMKIVNGILGRPIDTCVLIEGIKLWPDVASDAWYYYVVAEATNAHRYELTTPEKWTEIIVDEIEY